MKDKEASAPGLSDEQILEILRDIGPTQYDWPSKKGFALTYEKGIKFARAILTRASAATVFDPAEKVAPIFNPDEKIVPEFNPAATVAEPSEKVRGLARAVLAKRGLDNRTDEQQAEAFADFVCHEESEAPQQQTEPGADERAAFEAWLAAHPYPITWRERGAFFAGYRAAQSGQRGRQ